ncbi:MAG: hypothetical protein KDD22_07755 [Bdellovibrionales bacterium]|nr:hypothetical protein [Bdellovibrionales bacterium]
MSTPESETGDEESLVLVYFEESQYLSDSTNTANQSTLSQLGLRLEHEEGKNFTKKIDAHGVFSFTETRTPYIAVPELYFESNPKKNFYFTLGRKKKSWSRADELWHLGLWQPLARWDYFRPEPQGLTGLTLGVQNSWVGLELFGSTVFIPDQGPQFQIVNGHFESENRWFWKPQTQANVLGSERDLRYELVTPEVADVINNGSLAGRLWLGQYQKTAWASVAYADKPVNQFHLAVDPEYQIQLERASEPVVGIFPRVIRHKLTTVEVGVGPKAFNLTASLTDEETSRPEFVSRYMQSALSDNRWMALSMNHTLFFRDFEATWAYLQREVRNRAVHDQLMGSEVESSYDRFPIEEAASFSWKGTLRFFSQNFFWRGQYWYSIKEEGGWLSTGLLWQATRDLGWYLDFDVLGTNLDPEKSQGFISRYRGNDRVLVGMTYVF